MAEDSLAIQLEEWESGPDPSSQDAGALAPGSTVEEALLFESKSREVSLAMVCRTLMLKHMKQMNQTLSFSQKC